MNKLLQYPMQVNVNFGAVLKHLGRLSRTGTPALAELDARIQYDIGEKDCRPSLPKPISSYSTTLEAMLNRSI